MNTPKGQTSEYDGAILIRYKKPKQSDENKNEEERKRRNEWKRSWITALKGQRSKSKIVHNYRINIQEYDIVKDVDDGVIVLQKMPKHNVPKKYSLQCSECEKVLFIIKHTHNK